MGRIIAFLFGGGWKVWLAGAGVALLGAAVYMIRQGGADAQRSRQAQIDAKAGKIITQERNDARGASDADLDREVDRWSRK